MGKKEQRIVLASDHNPIRVGDKIVLETIGKRPPKITVEEVATRVEEVATRVEEVATKVEQLATRVEEVAMMVGNLAKVVYEGFKKIDEKFTKQEEFNKTLVARIETLEQNDKKIFGILERNNLY